MEHDDTPAPADEERGERADDDHAPEAAGEAPTAAAEVPPDYLDSKAMDVTGR